MELQHILSYDNYHDVDTNVNKFLNLFLRHPELN